MPCAAAVPVVPAKTPEAFFVPASEVIIRLSGNYR